MVLLPSLINTAKQKAMAYRTSHEQDSEEEEEGSETSDGGGSEEDDGGGSGEDDAHSERTDSFHTAKGSGTKWSVAHGACGTWVCGTWEGCGTWEWLIVGW